MKIKFTDKDKIRFEAKIIKTKSCWFFSGRRDRGGYGRFGVKGASNLLAHRVSFLLYKGLIPVGHAVCHQCDNTFCVNPNHLFTGTAKDNVQDCLRKGRHINNRLKALKQCKNGHAFDGANTHYTKQGYRVCRACHRAWTQKRYYAKRKE